MDERRRENPPPGVISAPALESFSSATIDGVAVFATSALGHIVEILVARGYRTGSTASAVLCAMSPDRLKKIERLLLSTSLSRFLGDVRTGAPARGARGGGARARGCAG